MNKKLGRVFAGLALLVLWAIGSAPAHAQATEVKEKPPMYTYVGFWSIPRAQWADMEKQMTTNQKLMEKGLADGTLVAYGSDMNLIHQPDGPTHDNWWSSTSMAGLLNVLDQVYKSGSATAPVLENASRHWDNIVVTRFYNWHHGSWKDVYSRVAQYNLKPEAPVDAVETLSKNLFVPLLEKMLADGTIHEYEIDTEAIHTAPPGMFFVEYIAANAEALDKVNAAVRDSLKANPMYGPAFGSVVDLNPHRDYLTRTNASYK